jgi:ribonucleoside-diphosphate reductase alpha chain
MMGAAQPFLSGAISKTVNMPRDTTPADIAQAYLEGWKLGLKALAVYRDGSKESQPLSTSTEGDKSADKSKSVPRRERLPDTRTSITHKFNVAGHEGYITVGLYPDGRPGELFITMAKEGSTIGGLMDAFGTAVSMSLQYGVPLEDYVRKFSHTRFEPMGFTSNPDIKFAKSIVDYIFRWLGNTFLPGFKEASQGETAEPPAAAAAGDDPPGQSAPAATKAGGLKTGPGGSTSAARPAPVAKETADAAAPVKNGAQGKNGAHPAAPQAKASSPGNTSDVALGVLQRAGVAPKLSLAQLTASRTLRDEQFAQFQVDAPACSVCGAITVRNGNCYLCHNCGNSMGCS